jgi:hypothetical protein
LSVAGSALSGDVKGAAITGGTYAAGRALQALPDPRAKLAGKALEFAAPFVPGAASALSSGSAKARPNKTPSGARTKADLIGGNAPKKPSSFNEKAYASQQKFSVPKSETPKQSAPAKPSPTASRPAAAPNRAPAAAPRMSAPVRRASAPAAPAKEAPFSGSVAEGRKIWADKYSSDKYKGQAIQKEAKAYLEKLKINSSSSAPASKGDAGAGSNGMSSNSKALENNSQAASFNTDKLQKRKGKSYGSARA